MTQEEKDLLIKDLSERLPYGVKFKVTDTYTITLRSIGIDGGLIPINLFYKKPEFYLINEFGNIEYKPYLRPMSSMTEKETDEMNLVISSSRVTGEYFRIVDFYNKHYLDYHDLIPKGLALEAPEGMYKTE